MHIFETLRAVPAEDPLIHASQWKILGQPLPKVNGRDFVTGKHRYPSDQTLPNMLHGKVLRPPAFNATLASADTQVAEQLPGVTVVRDGNFLGVAASTSRQAEHAASLILVQWKAEPQPSSMDLFEYL